MLCRYVYFVLDNYSTAKVKCHKAEYSSDINSDVPSKPSMTKRKVMKKTYGSSFEEDLSSSEDNENYNNNLSTPPRSTNGSYTYVCVCVFHVL